MPRRPGGVLYGRFGQQYAEFFPAQPAERIAGPLQTGAELGDAADHLVSGRMAIGVVDMLEMVDVEQQQAGGPLMTFEQGNGAVHFAEESAAAERAGQMIALRDAAQFELFDHQRREIPEDGDLRRVELPRHGVDRAERTDIIAVGVSSGMPA